MMKRKNTEEDEECQNEELSEYEIQRLENIRRNNEMLSSLNIGMSSSVLVERKKPATPRLRVARKTKPVRRSPRISGRENEPSNFIHDTSTEDFVTEERPSGPVEAVPTNEIDEADSRKFLNSLDTLSKSTKMSTSILEPEIQSVESYKERLSKLRVIAKNVRKVVPSKIASITFHPSCDKAVICAGDKSGNIGVWNVEATNESDSVFVYRPHVEGVRTMCFHPAKNDFMSCSYDGTLRRADFNTCVFEEVYASDDGITDFSYPFNSHETFLLGFVDGRMTVLDTRAPENKTSSHICHARTIKCLHCNPANEHLFCTSSIDGAVALWDLRKMKGIKSTLDCFERHSRSTTSAYFSPGDGKYVLTTSRDDTVKVLEVTPSLKFKLKKHFIHVNQTNRWLTPFRANWDPRNGRGFVIGSLLSPRRIQFYHVEQKTTAPLLEMLNEDLTTIVSINVFHPEKNIIASGNSSGKVFMWTD